MAFKQPKSLDECEERIAACAGEQSDLIAKRSDPVIPRTLTAYAYEQWKTGLSERMAFLVRERKLLEAWRSAANRKRVDDAIAAKHARTALRTDESQLIREMYGVLRVLYKHHGANLSDGAREVIERAEAYLTERDMLRLPQFIDR